MTGYAECKGKKRLIRAQKVNGRNMWREVHQGLLSTKSQCLWKFLRCR